MLHIYPVNDEQEHDTESDQCHCHPVVQWVDDKTGLPLPEGLVIHNAFDCREVVEQAEEIKNNASKL